MRDAMLVALEATGEPAEAVHGPSELIESVCNAYATLYRVNGYLAPWTGYFYVVDETCVGTCGFKSPPMDDRVEIAYFTFPQYEGRGYATDMARRLVAVAQQIDSSLHIAAQTMMERNASTRILEKLGFHVVGLAQDDEVGEVWEWRLTGSQT